VEVGFVGQRVGLGSIDDGWTGRLGRGRPSGRLPPYRVWHSMPRDGFGRASVHFLNEREGSTGGRAKGYEPRVGGDLRGTELAPYSGRASRRAS
jgi:hypothetical protein